MLIATIGHHFSLVEKLANAEALLRILSTVKRVQIDEMHYVHDESNTIVRPAIEPCEIGVRLIDGDMTPAAEIQRLTAKNETLRAESHARMREV